MFLADIGGSKCDVNLRDRAFRQLKTTLLLGVLNETMNKLRNAKNNILVGSDKPFCFTPTIKPAAGLLKLGIIFQGAHCSNSCNPLYLTENCRQLRTVGFCGLRS